MFLLDGLAVCCKPRGVLGMYRLKEKINLRHVKLADLEEAESAGIWRACDRELVDYINTNTAPSIDL